MHLKFTGVDWLPHHTFRCVFYEQGSYTSVPEEEWCWFLVNEFRACHDLSRLQCSVGDGSRVLALIVAVSILHLN
jgi:hypothetical protein